MKNFLSRFWPVLFILAVWFIFASPYFLKGLVPYSSTYQVNFFPPWSHYEKFLGPVKNNAMPDIHTQIYPWKKLTIDTYKNGEMPLWNPYSFSGNPHLANFQTAVFSPFNLLFFILPFIDAWSFLVLLQPLLAGYFMYLLLRQYKISSVAALLGSVCFMYAGFLVVWMAYGTLSYAILYLPLGIFLAEKLSETHKKRYLFFLSLTIPLSIFSGHFQTSLYFLIFLFSYIVWMFIRDRNRGVFIQSIIGLGVGLLFSLPQLLPTIQFYAYAVRSEIFISGGGIPWDYLVTTFAPDFYGNPVTRNDWYGYYAEWSSFVGIIPLVLATLAVAMRKNKNIVFYATAALFVLLLSVESPIQSLLGNLHIPVLSTSSPSRIIVLYSFCIAVLAAFGLDAVRNRANTASRTIFVLGVWLVIFVAVWGILLIGKPFAQDKIVIATRNLLLPTALFCLVLISIGTAFFLKRKFFLIISSVVLLFAASFDSSRFVQKWMPFDPKNLVYPDVPVIAAIKDNIEYGRMFGNFGGETAVYYGIPSIEGYDPLYIGRYGEFLRSADGNLIPAERSVAKISRDGKYVDRILDILGVNLIFHPRADTNQGWAYPVWENTDRYKLVYQDDKFELYKNTQNLERVHLFYSYIVEKDKQKILNHLLSESFDIRKTVVLEEDPHIKNNSDVPGGTARITHYSPNRVLVEVEMPTEGLIFLSDNYYPGWKAYVDGKETKIHRANYTFRAVPVPQGKHIVEFTYPLLLFSEEPGSHDLISAKVNGFLENLKR